MDMDLAELEEFKFQSGYSRILGEQRRRYYKS